VVCLSDLRLGLNSRAPLAVALSSRGSTDFRLTSESIRNWPDATTVPPSFRPLDTSVSGLSAQRHISRAVGILIWSAENQRNHGIKRERGMLFG